MVLTGLGGDLYRGGGRGVRKPIVVSYVPSEWTLCTAISSPTGCKPGLKGSRSQGEVRCPASGPPQAGGKGSLKLNSVRYLPQPDLGKHRSQVIVSKLYLYLFIVLNVLKEPVSSSLNWMSSTLCNLKSQ